MHQNSTYSQQSQPVNATGQNGGGTNATQSKSNTTNLIVRIDNSNAANHQIIKRKRLKDGVSVVGQGVMRSTASNNMGVGGGSTMGAGQQSNAGNTTNGWQTNEGGVDDSNSEATGARPLGLFVENMD